ncbi:MAG TPA: V-type ATPase subunit [Methanoregulaceae archaeon]|nr:V-type ATPase subunit [Methanoregulaceae archaeon]
MDQGYINSRVRGMYRSLLGPEEFRAFLQKPDLEAMIADLQKTPYRSALELSCVRRSGVTCLEEALRIHLVRTYSKIVKMFGDNDAVRYVRIVVNRWDVHNLKAILRGKNIHSPPEKIRECLVPAGTLDEATLIELLNQQDVRDVIDLLATWGVDYARAFTPHIEEWSRSRELLVMEHALDQYYFEYARRTVEGKKPEAIALRRLVGTEIDVTNLKTVITFIRDGVGPEDGGRFLLEGGADLPRELLRSMIEDGTLPTALGRLEGTPYAFLLRICDETPVCGPQSLLMKELDRHLVRTGAALYRSDPLSVSVVVGYLYLFLVEVTNLRIIARCRDAGLSDEELEAELIHV